METMVRKWWEQPYNRQSFERRGSLAMRAFLKSPAQRNELQQEIVNDVLRELSQHKRMEELRTRESELFENRKAAMPVLVSRRASTPKITRLLNRGDYQDNGPIVSPAVPDFQAFEFRDSGGNRNHMVRLLTSTKAYQLSSTPTAELAKRDPGNRFHARQGRSRLTAESIRDITLQSANLLQATNRIPTQSFFPY